MKLSFTYVLCSAALISAPLLFGTKTVLAGDAKTYPGSMCTRYAGSQPSYHYSFIGNPSDSQWLYLDCPVINDSMVHDLARSWVATIDRNHRRGHDITCTVVTAYWRDDAPHLVVWLGETKNSDTQGDGLSRLDTGRVGGAGEDVHTYFSCKIPPTYYGHLSHIVNYFAHEG
jgi:hypothetical protein